MGQICSLFLSAQRGKVGYPAHAILYLRGWCTCTESWNLHLSAAVFVTVVCTFYTSYTRHGNAMRSHRCPYGSTTQGSTKQSDSMTKSLTVIDRCLSQCFWRDLDLTRSEVTCHPFLCRNYFFFHLSHRVTQRLHWFVIQRPAKAKAK